MNSSFKGIDENGQNKIEYIREFFPELNEIPIKFNIMNSEGWYAGYCDWNRNTIRLTKESLICNHVITHELTHMASYHCGGIPKGEKACDMWALARSPILNDGPPGYICLPLIMRQEWDRNMAGLLSELARVAIKHRELGKRNYIQWFEESVKIANFFNTACEITGISTDHGILVQGGK